MVQGLLGIIYEILAIYAGYFIVANRFPALEGDSVGNKIAKFFVCWLVGNVVAVFVLIIIIIRLIKMLINKIQNG